MSSEHRRPMVAFLVVLILGVVVLVGAVRTEAVHGRPNDAAGRVPVVGRHLAPQPQVTPRSQRLSEAAVRVHATGTAAESIRSQRTAVSRASPHRSDRDPGDARTALPTHPPGEALGHARSRPVPPAHARAHGLGSSPGQPRARSHRAGVDREHTGPPHHGKGHGKGHCKGHEASGKAHGKARGLHRH